MIVKRLIAIVILCAQGSVFAADTPPPDSKQPPLPAVAPEAPTSSSYLLIDPKSRSADYSQAFDLLRREKAPEKIYFSLSDGTRLSSIIEMTPMSNSTLILFRYNPASQGVKIRVVRIEEIASVGLY